MDSGGEDFQSLPVTDRLQHKLWKARVSAYEEITSLLRKTDNDSDFYTYESYLKKIATDANAVAQEAGLNVIYEFVNNAPNASSTRETVVPAIVEKCLGATKVGTKQKATNILLLYAEIDVADPVVELVVPGINAKQPKLVTQTVIVLKEFVKQYGIKTVNPKPLLKIIPKLFGHTDKNVRAETSALTVELYRWLGPAINPYLSDLKPVQQKDLEDAFSKLPKDKATPERLLRSEQAAAAEAAAAAEEVDMDEGQDDGEGGDAMDEDPIDPYDLADPVDISSKLPGNFFDLLASKKWQERREALDALLEILKTPRLADKDYTELMGALAKRISDTNILLVGSAANCIERIAIGLRQDFGKYKGVVALPMTEKLKERKPAILEHLSNGLNAVFASVPLSEIIEDITTGVKHKNPQVRANSVKLLSRRLKETRIAPVKSEYKAFAELMLKTLDDADGGAREASAEGLGTLMKVIGEKAILPWTESLDDIKMGKIKEACEKAEVKAKPVVAKKPPPPAKKAPTAKPPVKKVAPKPKPAAAPEPMALDDEAAPPVSPPKRKPPARLAGGSSSKKPTLSSSKPKPKPAASAAAAAGPKKAAKLPPSSGPEEVRYRFSAEDAEARTTEFVPEQIWNDLQQSQWKVRLAAMESLYSHFDQMDPVETEPEIVFRVFSKKPGWKEMNFQVMGKLFATMQLLAEKCPNFTKACVAIAVQVLVEKLGDIKLKKAAGECLVVFAEKTSLQFVFSQSYPIWKKAKSPKVLADSLTWIHTAVMEFGITGLQVRDLIEFLKFALGNTNASVRTSAVTVLGALRLYIGPEVKSFVQDVTPALMANIEAEFDKVAQMEPPTPTRTTAESQAASRGGGGGGGNAAADAVESLFPRVDISSPLSKASSECSDANWKVRKEGLEKVLSIIEGANKRIKPNLGEFPGVLKQRLNDSNKNLQIMALEIAGLLAESSGKPFEKYLKPLTGPVTASLSDNKANVRAAGVTALEQFRKVCGLEGMIGSFATSLAADSPMLRKELLSWLATHLKEDKNAASYDLAPIIAPMLSCLQDRNGDVRKSAQACIPIVIASAGYDAVVHKAADLKGAQRQAIMPIIEANRGAASAAAVSAPPAAPTSAPVKRVSTAKASSAAAAAGEDAPKASSIGRTRMLSKRKPGLQAPRASGIAPPSSASAPPAAASSAEAVQAPVLTSDPRAKQLRAKKEIRWQFDTPRPDIQDGLRTSCEPNMSAEVCSLLFSTSQYAERDRLNGLNLLNECMANPEVSSDKYDVDFSDMKERFIVNADLILKYLTIRFFDTNTSMLIKCLDITQNMVAIMDEEGYHLTEYEAVSFLPFLINKVGDPKEVMRTRIRNILKSICRIYPASKLFNYLLDSAATSKNAKARAECLEEVGALIQRNGISVMLPNKSLPLIATHIGDRDAGVRNAALNAIAQAYILTGDVVFKYVSRLGEKEKGMLEERLKRTKPSASVLAEKEAREKQEAQEMEIDEFPTVNQLPRLPRPSHGKQRTMVQPSAPPPQPQQRQYDPEPMEDVTDDYGNQFNEPGGMAGINEPRTLPGPSSMRQPRSATHQAFQKAVQQDRGEYIVDYLISQITSGDPQPSIEALKQLDKLLNSKPDLILPDIEPLINAITLQVRLAYSNVDPRVPAMTRLCKHLVNALVLLFSNRDLACAVSQEALHHLLEELAHRLLDQKMLAMESGPQLSKALNVAMVKVLENSHRNATFSALLSILGSCAAGLRPGDDPSAKETRYTELTMKCLWKLAKTVQENLRAGTLNPDELLYEINKFFITTPPAEWKRRAAENVPLGEMPLRTVKTLLLELVNGLGDSIFQHLTLIDNPPASSVYPYLHHMLEACRKRERMQQARLQQQQQQAQQQPPPQSPVGMQQQQQQQRYSMHSLNSSMSRPSSISSLQSNGMLRSASMASYPSGEGDASSVTMDATIPVATPMRNNNTPINNNTANNVQPMQLDEEQPQDPNKPLSDYEMNNLLTQIFVKIGTRDQTKQGIVELYEFQKKYPLAEAKVNTYLSQSGTYFQSYIRRGLSNLAAEDNELRSNTSPPSSNHHQQQQQQQQQPTPSPAATPIAINTMPSSASPPLANTTVTSQPSSTPSGGEYSSHHSSPRNSSSPQISSPVLQEQKQSFDLHRTSSMSGVRASMHADDATEIKQRLQRLKQKFGGKTSQQQQHY
ncbi:armadillo-type protein [Phascolomyces articulosus]|uniref:Armadillo-type protein n=1 Tax=Phascolomyces articulosus TaxID=60185 RepID=A0AAD5K7E5_9FUNG|nr:armadillo-type protein [Phascolomyces articulosus]